MPTDKLNFDVSGQEASKEERSEFLSCQIPAVFDNGISPLSSKGWKKICDFAPIFCALALWSLCSLEDFVLKKDSLFSGLRLLV